MNAANLIPAFDVLATAEAAGLFDSLCTIERHDGTEDALGRPTRDDDADWDEVAGLDDIECMIAADAVASQIRNSFEKKTQTADESTDVLHVLLNGYYPTIEHGDRAQLTRGVTVLGAHEITGIEHSSDSQMTRLAVQAVKL